MFRDFLPFINTALLSLVGIVGYMIKSRLDNFEYRIRRLEGKYFEDGKIPGGDT